ncbi:hypothetical protein [Nocardia sp. NPDC004123]
MHVDIDHCWPLAAAFEAALLGGWLVVVARIARPGEHAGPHREPTGARGEGAEPRGDWAPVLTLLLWATLIPEILPVPSANLVTKLPGFMLMYGGAAVLARAAVRTRGLGWPALLCLATAWSLLEEFVLCQTSIHHVYWPLTYGGSPFGVNAMFLLWAFSVEAVGGFLVATQLTELMFPDRRTEPWLSRPAAWTGGIVWLIGLPITWYGCAYFLERGVLGRHITPPLPLVAIPAVLALALVAAALTRPRAGRVRNVRRYAPPPWSAGVVAAVLATLWLSTHILILGGGPAILFGHPIPGLREIPAWAMYLAVFVVAVTAVTLLQRWSAAPQWTDMHRFAVCAGVLAAAMIQACDALAGTEPKPGRSTVGDWAVQLEVNALVIAVLVALGLRLRRPPAPVGAAREAAAP